MPGRPARTFWECEMDYFMSLSLSIFRPVRGLMMATP